MSKKKRMNAWESLAFWLVTIGAINWGLGVFGFNAVEFLTFGVKWLATTAYLLVGVAGFYTAYMYFKLK